MPDWDFPHTDAPRRPPEGWRGGSVQRIAPVGRDGVEEARIWRRVPDDAGIEVYYLADSPTVVYREAHPLGWDPVVERTAAMNTERDKIRTAIGLMREMGANVAENPHNDFDFERGAP